MVVGDGLDIGFGWGRASTGTQVSAGSRPGSIVFGGCPQRYFVVEKIWIVDGGNAIVGLNCTPLAMPCTAGAYD